MSLQRPVIGALTGLLVLIALLSVVGGSAVTADADAPTRGANVTVSSNLSVESVTVWTAPEGVGANLSSAADVEAAIDDGTLMRDDRVVWSDTLVLELHAPGLDDRMAAVGGANETDRFLRVTYDEDGHLTLFQTNPTVEREPVATQFDPSSTTVYDAEAADTYYLLVEPTRMDVGICATVCYDADAEGPVGESVDTHRLWDDAALAMNVTIDGNSTSLRRTSDGRPAPVFEMTEIHTDVIGERIRDDGRVPVRRDARAPVGIQTSLAPGTAVTVRLTDRSDGGPALSNTTTVRSSLGSEWEDEDSFDPDHDAVARFNTTELATNATVDIQLLVDGEVIGESTGIVSSEPTPTATATATPTSTARSTSASGERSSTTGTQSPTGTDGGAETTPTDAGDPTATGGTGPGFGPLAALLAAIAGVLALRCRGD